jgi:hypothetical protein
MKQAVLPGSMMSFAPGTAALALRPAVAIARFSRPTRWPEASAAPLLPSPALEIIDAVPARVLAKIKAPRRRIGRLSDQNRRRLPPTIMALSAMALAAVLLGRAEIVRGLPETASLFRSIGLPVNLRGLAFAGLETRLATEGGVPVLIVAGRIESRSQATVVLPPLRMAVRDAAGAELYAWTVRPDAAALRAGESLPFRARLVSPPTAGYDVLVRFSQPSDR